MDEVTRDGFVRSRVRRRPYPNTTIRVNANSTFELYWGEAYAWVERNLLTKLHIYLTRSVDGCFGYCTALPCTPVLVRPRMSSASQVSKNVFGSSQA